MLSRIVIVKAAALVLSVSAVAPRCLAADLRVVPVQFTGSVDASEAKPGDHVTARTMQAVVLRAGYCWRRSCR